MIDSHAHLTGDSLYEEIDALLDRAWAAGLRQIVNINTDASTLERGLALKKRYPWVLHTAATTPHDVEAEGESFFPLVKAAAERGDLVAIGETGLDYHYTFSPRELQHHWLEQYLQLAEATSLPVVIHCREAFADLFAALDRHPTLKGVLHCFTGTLAEAKEVIARGWYLSLSGIVTFKNSEELREVAAQTPLDQLLIETDAPYLAPQGYRGKRCEPAYLPITCAAVAAAKNLSLEQVAAATAHNAQTLFHAHSLH